MFTIPNLLSALRFPLAFLFLKDDVVYRTIALILAMASDGLDGYLARRYKQSSAFGTLLDPIMDRFFVFFLIGIFMNEGSLGLWEVSTMVCRDFSVALFGFYLVFSGQLAGYRFRAIMCGKVTTAFQFLVFLGITLGYAIPPFVFSLFLILGFLALIELYLSKEVKLADS
jgi:CDP-diacylglycerol---glycerol-3-phosphate 3-phosphatidyltransferase